jgi:transcriptional regulator with XRE-family HTH domain
LDVNKNFASHLYCIGSTIRNLRLQKKMTQSHLATLCDIDIRSIQRIEKGQQNISVSLLFLIAESLEISAQLIIKDCDIKVKP